MPEHHPPSGDAFHEPDTTGGEVVDVMTRLSNLTRQRPIFGPHTATAAAPTPTPDAAPLPVEDADPPVKDGPDALNVPHSVGSSPTPTIGRLTTVRASDLWPTSSELAAWIASDPGVLAETIGLTIPDAVVASAPTRVSGTDASGASVSIVCDTGESTDASLAAVLEIAALGTSSTVIWVAGEPANGHMATVSWLNGRDDARFFLVRVSGVRIGDSSAAAAMEVVVRPPRSAARQSSSADEPETGRRADDHDVGAA